MRMDMLEADDVERQWSKLLPMLQASCNSNDVGVADITPKDIRDAVRNGTCALFVGFLDDKPGCIIALQFSVTNGNKGADIVAMAGKHLMKFKDAYWDIILEWLRGNGCKFVDAYANERLASIYQKKFGFDRSCTYVRKML